MPTGSKPQRSRYPTVSAEARAAFKAQSITRAMDGLTRAAAVAKTRELGPEGICMGLAADLLALATTLQDRVEAETAQGNHDRAYAISCFIGKLTDDAGRYMRLAHLAMLPAGRPH
jgi:CTP synthase (UTP-ammonia lyase)